MRVGLVIGGRGVFDIGMSVEWGELSTLRCSWSRLGGYWLDIAERKELMELSEMAE